MNIQRLKLNSTGIETNKWNSNSEDVKNKRILDPEKSIRENEQHIQWKPEQKKYPSLGKAARLTFQLLCGKPKILLLET